MTNPPPRGAAERKEHVLHLLESEPDVWVATASLEGGPALIPLSFAWTGSVLVLSTPAASPTGRNLGAGGAVRIALGGTRDVVMIDGRVRAYSSELVPAGLADPFAAKHTWDPRKDTSAGGAYAFFEVTPVRIQAWREENELKGRTLMREGGWLV
ncbi:pyridoxamine 5'-phosphate oxidase family protein [Actinospica sp.]|uniref:pyridoxamine 5'-phosphate oxidase family protein n=1 Tax=Actinospica sp. TaxID=1872142 RepID=UPI002C5EEA6D|nr:pyridoxamine 5'-phosphate oxidase family protein [Actinospica sp.]HWG26260.1 pyridoxamine 5'-phosphate oxidase family protein [Actinospica sp.]